MPTSHLALTNEGDLVAQLHQSTVSVRSQSDEYSALKWKYVISPADPAPQRQRLSWNCDGSLLAVSTSDSKLLVFNRSGKLIHRMDVKMYQGKEVGGVVDVAWSRDSTLGGRRTCQLFLLTFSGLLMRYLVYPHDSDPMFVPLSQVLSIKDDPKLGPSSTLRSILSRLSVITSMDISPNGKFIAIAGYGRPFKRSLEDSSSSSSKSSPKASSHSSDHQGEDVMSPSVGFWRILDTAPFFEFASPMYLDHLEPIKEKKLSSSKRCCGKRSAEDTSSKSHKSVNLVRDVQFSHDSSHLLTLDMNGVLTIWDVEKQLPIRMYRSEGIWRLTNGNRAFPNAPPSERVIHSAKWWTNNSVFLMHAGGASSVFGPLFPLETKHHIDASAASHSASLASSIAVSSSSQAVPVSAVPNHITSSHGSLSRSGPSTPSIGDHDSEREHNMLGPLPEKFSSNSIVSRAHKHRIFIFETEISPVQVPRKRLLYTGSGSSSKQDIDPDLGVPYDYEMEGANQPSCLKKAALSTWRFFVGHTDDKWGEMNITKQRVTNRLLSLRKVTPEDLFLSKIASREHDFALSLASHYKINPDLAFQTRWRSSIVSELSIKEYLDKVSDRNWVLRECIERVPGTLEAARMLLEYGIKHAVPSWLEKESGNRTDLSEAEQTETTQRLAALSKAIARKSNAQLDLSQDLGEDEEEDELLPSKSDIKILLQRLILLSHYDRLCTYAKINDRNQHFDAREYLNFRTCSLVNACSTFAQNEDIRALETIWTYHGDSTLPYRLIVLSYLPETLPADSSVVSHLFPAVADIPESADEEVSADASVTQWKTKVWRKADWAESVDILAPLLGLSSSETKPAYELRAIERYLPAYSRAHQSEQAASTATSSSQERYTRERSMLSKSRLGDERTYEDKKRELVDTIACGDIFSVLIERPEPLVLDKPLPNRFTRPILERELTAGDLSKWYKLRAIDVENLSGQADNALTLVSLGIRNGVPKLAKIHAKLKLLCSLVYECGKSTELAEFEHMDDLRRLHFLLEDSTPSNIIAMVAERCEVYLHNAHVIWRQYETEGTPSFTAAFLTAWMCDIAKASASTTSTVLGYDMLPHLVQIFRSSARALGSQNLHAHSSSSSLLQDASTLPTSSSTSQLASPSRSEYGNLDEPIIPTQYMLGVLGLHILYLCTPLTKDHLSQIHAIYSVLPKRPTTRPNSSVSSASTSLGESASSSISGVTANEGDPLMDPIYDRVELLGRHLKAAEILLRHDMIKPLEAFFSSWRADDPLAMRVMMEHLVQKDVRSNPNLTNSKWRETLKDMQELRETLNSSRSFLDQVTSSAASSPAVTPLDRSSAISTATDASSSVSSSQALPPSTPKKGSSVYSSAPLSSPLGRSSPSHAGTPPPPPSPSAPTPSKSKLLQLPTANNTSLQPHLAALSVDLPYEIFCQALLRSGNFSLAKHYLYDLPNYESLVISVAQEYFNSCSSAMDKDMQLAQECLGLIKIPTAQAHEEQKLIDAVVKLSRLEDTYQVPMKDVLPIQVRRSRDRMSYLRQLLEPPSTTGAFKVPFDLSGASAGGASPLSPRGQPEVRKEEIYTNLEDLIALGRLLGCASSDAERQEIKLLAANRAFKAKDYEVSSKWCIELTASPSSSLNGVWDLAYRLAMVEKVDINVRTQLLAFAMRHAPQETLQSMISLWRALEMRAGCASIGLKIDMPKGVPTHLHLNERVPTRPEAKHASTSSSVARTPTESRSHSPAPVQPTPDPLSLRLDPKKVNTTQSMFVNTCVNKLEEMNQTQWMAKMQTAADSYRPASPHIYGFYRPVANRAPYHQSDTQLRIDAATGPLATFGNASVEREILSKIRSLLLSASPNLASSRLESVLIQLAQLSAAEGDISMLMSMLLDPSVTPSSAAALFDALLSLATSGPVAQALVHLSKYHFAVLTLQLFLSFVHDEETAAAYDLSELQHSSLFDYNPLQLIKRAKKFIAKSKSSGTALFEREDLNRTLEELSTHFEHFANYVIPTKFQAEVKPASPVNGHKPAPESPETKPESLDSREAVIEMAKKTSPESLERALQLLSNTSISSQASSSATVDEFTLLEAHFTSLVKSQSVSMKALHAFLQRYDDELIRHHTLRFESTLEALWKAPESGERPLSIPRLLLLLNLQVRVCKHHATAAAAHPQQVTKSTEKYGTRVFADRKALQAKALEDLGKALRAHAESASPPNDLDWRSLLEENAQSGLATIKNALTTSNVHMIAKSASQLNQLIVASKPTKKSHPEADEQNGTASNDSEQLLEPFITSSSTYFMLFQSIIDSLRDRHGKGKEVVREVANELKWFVDDRFYERLDASLLHQLIEQYIGSPDFDILLRKAICDQISEYLRQLLEGEEDETILLLKRLSTHLEALMSLKREWSTLPGGAPTTLIKQLDASFSATDPHVEIVSIATRMLANGFPISSLINIIEVFDLYRAQKKTVLDMATHIVSEAVRTASTYITTHASESGENNAETLKEEPQSAVHSDFAWPPSSVAHARFMLRRLLKTIIQSGSNAFCKDSLSAVRDTAYAKETAAETRVSLLRTLLEFPGIYETRRDWILQDEKCVERFIISNILESGLSEEEGSTSSENEDKLASIRKLVEKKNFATAFQLLWMWSNKAEKEDLEAKHRAEIARQSKDVPKPSSFAADDSVAEGDGWGFDDAAPEATSSAPAAKEQKASSSPAPILAVASLAPSWKVLLQGIAASHDSKLLVDVRSKVKSEWLGANLDAEIFATLLDSHSLLWSWKYAFVCNSDDSTDIGVASLKKHLGKLQQPSENLRGFFRGLMSVAGMGDSAPPLKYGTDYDAQLLRLMLKSGAFVHFAQSALLWPLLLEVILFIHKSKPIASVESLSPEHQEEAISDYQKEREEAIASFNRSDASLSFARIVSELILSSHLSAAAIVAFEQIQVTSNAGSAQLRSLERFFAMVPQLLTSYANDCKARISKETGHKESSTDHLGLGSAAEPRVGLTWHETLSLILQARHHFDSLKL